MSSVAPERKRSRAYREAGKVFRAMVHDHCQATGDSEEDVAAELHLSASYLNNQLNGHSPVHLDLVLRAGRLFADSRAAALHARMAGGLFVPMPDCGPVEVASVRTAIREHAEAIDSVLKGAEDGRITAAEAETINRECWEAAAAILALALRCEAESKRVRDGRAATLAAAH